MSYSCRIALLVTAVIGCTIPAAAPAAAVVGGDETPATDHPWLAAIGIPLYFPRPAGQFCAGELIAPDQLLTAAHCVEMTALVPQMLTVTFDRTDLGAPGGKTVGVTAIRVNPKYRTDTVGGVDVYHNDVAVLTLAEPQNRPTVEIAAPHGDSATVLGWGGTSESDLSNRVLRTATVPMVPDTDCAGAYPGAFNPADMICAGSPTADTGQYDSGGPVLVDGKLVAITSWARGTARPGFPGVYSRLPVSF